MTPEGPVGQAGSYGHPLESKGCPTWILNLRRKLQDHGVLEITNDRLTLLKDHLFNSPTAAAGVTP